MNSAVSLTGSASARTWLPNCTFHDQGAPIQIDLFYQPIGGNPTNVTSWLTAPPDSNNNSFTAGAVGIMNVLCSCPTVQPSPGVPGTVGQTIYVGAKATFAGQATVWIQNEFLGVKKFQQVSATGVMLILPNGNVLFVLDPLQLPNASITQQPPGGSGSFNAATGELDVVLHLDVTAKYSGTADATVSTEFTITPPQDNPVSGTRRASDGTLRLVGDAPIVGPPGTTHGWIQIDGALTLPS